MNIKKILIISLFLLILANITIEASYAVSNEKITQNEIIEVFYKETFDNSFHRSSRYMEKKL